MTDPLTTLFPPVPHDDDAERAARARGLAALREAAGDRPAVAAPRRARPRRRWLLAPAAVAAVAAAVVIALTSGVDEGRLTPSNSAAALLTRAADGAERSPAVGALAPGQFLYVKRTETDRKTVTRRGQTFVVDVTAVFEDWIARDGSGRYRTVPGGLEFPTPADRAAWKRAGSPTFAVERDDQPRAAWPEHAFPSWVGSQAVSYAQARALPTDPVQLERTLRADTKTPGTGGLSALRLFERIVSLLSGAPLDPAQRAALYRVTAQLPGVRVEADALVPGASAVSAQADVDGSHYRVTMVFDPATGRLRGIRTLITGRISLDHRVLYDMEVRSSLHA